MWWTLGQEDAVARLQADLASGSPAHAYLFAGPPQTGKATLAREFAMALNCAAHDPGQSLFASAGLEMAAPEGPCHECRPCQRIGGGKHADVQVLGKESPCEEPNEREHDHASRQAAFIRVCQVHRVRRQASEAAFEGRQRVFIIDPADALNPESANALLKTLEEPPPNVTFVLVTAREDDVRETVRSRCRRIELHALPAAEIAEYLEAQRGVERTEARALARLSAGHIGWAIDALERDGMTQRREAVEKLVGLGSAGRPDRFAAAAELARLWTTDRARVRETLAAWSDWWRDILLVAAGQPELVAHLQLKGLAIGEGARYSALQAVRFLEALRDTEAYLEDNVNPRLALEVLLLSLPVPDRKEARAGAPA